MRRRSVKQRGRGPAFLLAELHAQAQLYTHLARGIDRCVWCADGAGRSIANAGDIALVKQIVGIQGQAPMAVGRLVGNAQVGTLLGRANGEVWRAKEAALAIRSGQAPAPRR